MPVKKRALQFEEQLWLCIMDGYIYCIFIFEAHTCFVTIRTYIVNVSAGKIYSLLSWPRCFCCGGRSSFGPDSIQMVAKLCLKRFFAQPEQLLFLYLPALDTWWSYFPVLTGIITRALCTRLF